MNAWKSISTLPIVLSIILSDLTISQASAGAFENLGFEEATIGTPQDFKLPASDALPFWTVSTGNFVVYDTVTLGSTAVSIHDGLNYWGPSSSFMKPLQGNFSVLLQSGYNSPQRAWISQTGDVPAEARSLMFCTDFSSDANIVVSLDGIPVPISLYSVGNVINSDFGPVKTYIGDISAFSGREDVTLRFEAVPIVEPALSSANIDMIAFSSIEVPEPSAFALLGIGILLLPGFFGLRRDL